MPKTRPKLSLKRHLQMKSKVLLEQKEAKRV